MFHIPPVSRALDEAIRRAIDSKTKPPGALGVVEAVAAQIARVQNTLTPELRSCRLTLFAGDHGIAAESVSAYPQAVTRQMVANFLAGGAAANVFARTNGVELQVVDAGVAGGPIEAPGLVSRRARATSGGAGHDRGAMRNGLARRRGPGRSRGGGHGAFGEMGIGNTSSATLVAHKLTGTALDSLVGRGAGLDDAGLSRKQGILEQAARRTAAPLDARDALREYGGFEIVMMAGAMMGAARAGAVVLVDGFIASVAALAATEMAPPLRDYLLRSPVRRARPRRGAGGP